MHARCTVIVDGSNGIRLALVLFVIEVEFAFAGAGSTTQDLRVSGPTSPWRRLGSSPARRLLDTLN
jgi:hypothetical protein